MNVSKRILVIEDNQDLREATATLLDLYGYQVFGAANGAQALDTARQCQPDLILLDMQMPVMDGRVFLNVYQQIPGRHAPVIGMSGYPLESCGLTGVDGFVVKPYLPQELLDLVQRHILGR